MNQHLILSSVFSKSKQQPQLISVCGCMSFKSCETLSLILIINCLLLNTYFPWKLHRKLSFMMKFICALRLLCTTVDVFVVDDDDAMLLGHGALSSSKHVISIKLFFVASALFLHFILISRFHSLFCHCVCCDVAFPMWHHLFAALVHSLRSGKCINFANVTEFHLMWCFIHLHLGIP